MPVTSKACRIPRDGELRRAKSPNVAPFILTNMNPMHTPDLVMKRCFLLVAIALLFVPLAAQAQDRPPQRVIRTYVPPDQLVSFLPATPFNQFVEFLTPIFERVTGKQVIDPESRTSPIEITVTGMHFFDAFELVLEYQGLTFRETDQFFIIETRPAEEVVAAAGGAVQAPATAAASAVLPATLDSREIQIRAILFQVDLSKARDIGLNWSTVFGENQGQGAGGGQFGNAGGNGNEQSTQGINFSLKTDELFDGLDDVLISPTQVQFSDLANFFRILETEGIGETIANPQVTVQSGQQGRIQIGSDVPIQTQDFAGNTITEYISTGIIIDVKPTLIEQAIEDTTDSPTVSFIHLDTKVENSNGRPSGVGTVIDRSVAQTQVTLLDGEQTIIGGLYATGESVSRRGIPLLKDLPGWFLGLRYVFGRTQRTTTQRELVIVLEARLIDSLLERSQRPLDNQILERNRRESEQSLQRFDESISSEMIPRN